MRFFVRLVLRLLGFVFNYALLVAIGVAILLVAYFPDEKFIIFGASSVAVSTVAIALAVLTVVVLSFRRCWSWAGLVRWTYRFGVDRWKSARAAARNAVRLEQFISIVQFAFFLIGTIYLAYLLGLLPELSAGNANVIAFTVFFYALGAVVGLFSVAKLLSDRIGFLQAQYDSQQTTPEDTESVQLARFWGVVGSIAWSLILMLIVIGSGVVLIMWSDESIRSEALRLLPI